jgi:hypothetical protein
LGKVIVAGVTVVAMSAKVLLAAPMTSEPVPAFSSFGHDAPPPLNVLAAALVMLILPVPGVTVRFVAVVAVKFVLTLIEPAPNVIARTLLLFVVKVWHESTLPFKSSVPAVCVTLRVLPSVSASCNCTVAPGALTVIGPSIGTLFVVICCVPEVAPNVSVPTAPHVIPDATVRLP